jgi:hypothetical protein
MVRWYVRAARRVNGALNAGGAGVYDEGMGDISGAGEAEKPTVPEGTTECPVCGGRLVPILYGLPTPEAGAAADRGEIELGGCLVTGDDPQLACRGCHERFWIAPQ